jgi:hypothetical protein
VTVKGSLIEYSGAIDLEISTFSSNGPLDATLNDVTIDVFLPCDWCWFSQSGILSIIRHSDFTADKIPREELTE